MKAWCVGMERYKGRPQDGEVRLAKEIRVYDYLDGLHVEYERVDHEAAMTMEVCEEIDKVLDAAIVKICFSAIGRRRNFIFC